MIGLFLWHSARAARRKTAPLPDEVRSIAEFRRLLAKERMRADRSGATFAVLSVLPPPGDQPSVALARLAQRVVGRIRFTDETGLLDERQLGIFLPDTSAEGARKLAGDLMALYAGESAAPRCQLYVYPESPAQLPQHPAEPAAPRSRQRVAGAAQVGSNGTNVSKASRMRLRRSRKQSRAQAAPSPNARRARANVPLEPSRGLFLRPLPAWKRAIDIIGAGLLLVVTLPMFLLTALAIKLASRGPVFFVQYRDGLGGRPFRMFKFRTMRVGADAEKEKLRANSEQDGPAFKIKRDPRITSIGQLLRKTSIDELPQLFNVLRGEMSLVGPRPLPCDESAKCLAWQRRRLDVTPGLTCIWQVSGRSSVSFHEWMRMDLAYIRSRTLLHDLKLLFLTIFAVLLQRGAH